LLFNYNKTLKEKKNEKASENHVNLFDCLLAIHIHRCDIDGICL
jgi:hypothetical protein